MPSVFPTTWRLVLYVILLIVGGVMVLAYLVYEKTRSRIVGSLVGIVGLVGIYLVLERLGLITAILNWGSPG